VSTMTEFFAARRAAVRAESPDEPIGLDTLLMWRDEWAREVRDAANSRRVVDIRTARSYIRVFGRDALRDLRGASNIDELCVEFPKMRSVR